MKRSATSIIWGLILIGLGIGFLLNTMGIYNFRAVFTLYWPALLILVSLGELFSRRFAAAFLWALLGVFFFVRTLNLATFDFWPALFSLVLIWIGINVLFRNSVWERRSGEFAAEEDFDDKVNATAIFGGVEKKIESQDFKGAAVTAIFGGSKIDLRHAKLSDNGAVIDVVAVFGGAEVIAPKGMPVRIDATALFGGSEDKTDHTPAEKGKKGLIIKGTVLFGGVEVKN